MKNIQWLLENEILSLPNAWDGVFFPEYVNNLFREYIGLLKTLNPTGDYYNKTELVNERISNSEIVFDIPKIEAICNGLINVIAQYYNGKPYNAYKEFNKVMKEIKPCLRILQKSGDLETLGYQDNLYLYRVRQSEDSEINLKDIFHLPLEYRTKAPNCRYSIPGYPCLYLGTSVYGCWEEIGRPGFEKLIVSKFALNRTSDRLRIKVIDFGMRPQYLAYLLRENRISGKQHFINYIISWPLLAACSIVVKDREQAVKPEYIVPQIFLQWIRNEYEDDNTLYGIRYFSCSTESHPISSKMFYNYVFPIDEKAAIMKYGFSEKLREAFEFTEPIKWSESNRLSYDSLKGFFRRTEHICLPGIASIDHRDTEFDLIENLLERKRKEKF